MTGKIVYTSRGERCLIDGQEVSRAEFDKAFPFKEGVPMVPAPSCWPKKSSAGWVHPTDIGKATAEAVRLGVPTEFTPDGDPVMRDRKHRKDYFEKVRGMFDADGGDGDPMPQGVKLG